MTEQTCEKCKGTGRVRHKDGAITTCFDCLLKGNLDQHDKKIKSAEELGMRL